MAEQPLKILIVTQYFWPENMRINDLAEGMIAKGHEVTVLTGIPNYPDGKVFPDYQKNPDHYSTHSGARIVRTPMLARGKSSITLALNYISFFVSASIFGPYKLRNQKFDVIFACSLSPVFSVIPAIVLGRLKKAPVFTWVLDLWPESLNAVGIIKNKKILTLIGKVVSWIYNRTDYLLAQSKGFEGNLRKYCTKEINPTRIIYFPSWAEDDFSETRKSESDLLSHDKSVFTVVFAGNIGEAQDFPSILQAAEEIQNDIPVRWVVVGSGRASAWLHEEVVSRKLDNVRLLGRHPLEKMPALFSTADALLVSLKTNEVFAKTIPGKVQAYLASGRPIIAMIDGEAARVVQEAEAGMVCVSGDAASLADIVRKMAALPVDQREEMGKAGRRFYLENFSKPRLFDRLEKLFKTGSLRKEETTLNIAK